MLDKIIEEIKTINGIIYSAIVILSGCFLLVKFWDKVSLTSETCFQSIMLLLPHGGSILFVIVLFITKRYLFKLSDKKSQERINEYDKPLVVESKESKYISAKLIESYKKLGKQEGQTLEIIIKNKFENNIDFLKGYISLYKNLTKISQINFESIILTSNIMKGYFIIL